MRKPVFQCAHALAVLSLLGVVGCYAKVEVSDSSAEKAIAIDLVEPPCAEPGSPAGYIEGNGFGAENVTVTVGGIEAEVLAATGKDASFVVPEGIPPGDEIEVVVMNPGGRLATIQWVVCGFDCSAIDCTSDNECVEDGTCDPATGMCIDGGNQPADTACGDGDVCDGQGNCVECNDAGQCTEDDNDCTAASCIDGACGQSDLPDGTMCDLLSVDDGVCMSGVCAAAPDCTDAADCNDGNECTADTCDPAVEMCIHTPVTDGVACDFGGVPGLCIAGVCAEECPVLTNVLATPPQANVGDEINVSAEASGAGPINYLWTATGGSFVDPSLPTTAYRCEELGQQDLTITISDGTGFCTDESTVTVTCLGGPDTDPPVLTDFDCNPKEVDVSTGEQTVTCTIGLADTGTGVDRTVVVFISPGGGQSASCPAARNPVSGDQFNGTWICDITFEVGSEEGTWTARLDAYDDVGNSDSWTFADLANAGYPSELQVTSASPDTDPPVLTDFDCNPKEVDVSTGEQTVTCTIGLADTGTGVDRTVVVFISPGGGQSASCPAARNPVSGDQFNGTWICDITFEVGSEEGTWTARLDAYDDVGNSDSWTFADLANAGYPSELQVTSASPDTDPPVLTDFDCNPKEVDVSTGEQTVTCTIGLADTGTGVDRTVVVFISPGGGQSASCPAARNPVSGDQFNGTWICDITFEVGSEEGTWTARLDAYDDVGNSDSWTFADLANAGYPSELQVTYGP